MKWFFISLLAATLIFQNCSGTESGNSDASSKSSGTQVDVSGNGEGYDGKVYVDRNTDGQCGSDPDITKTAIEQKSDGFYQIVEDCLDITPKKLANIQVSYFDVNDEVLVFQDRPLFRPTHLSQYDGLTLNARLFCRGVLFEQGTTSFKTVDTYFHSELPGPKYYSKATIGYYSGPGVQASSPDILAEREVFESTPNIGPNFPSDVFILPYDYNGGIGDTPDGNPGYRLTFFTNDFSSINQAAVLYNEDGLGSTPPEVDNIIDCYNY